MRALCSSAAALRLAGCLGNVGPASQGGAPQLGGDSDDAASAIAADPLIAEPHAGNDLWDCMVPGAINGASWQFAIRKAGEAAGADILLATDGSTLVTRLDRHRESGKDVFTAFTARSGSGRIAVAPTGAAQVDWPGIGLASGHCHEGEQS